MEERREIGALLVCGLSISHTDATAVVDSDIKCNANKETSNAQEGISRFRLLVQTFEPEKKEEIWFLCCCTMSVHCVFASRHMAAIHSTDQ